MTYLLTVFVIVVRAHNSGRTRATSTLTSKSMME